MKPKLKQRRGIPKHRQVSLSQLLVLFLSGLAIFGSIRLAAIAGNPIFLILYTGMSILTFSLYAYDKFSAKQGKWRVSEKNLHICEFFGGWIGGAIAQQVLRHKTVKSSYQRIFWLIVATHTIIWADWLFLDGLFVRLLTNATASK